MNQSRFARVAGVAGIVGIVLLLIANVQLGNPPKAEDSAESVATFLADHRDKALVFVVLFGLGYMALLTFAAGLSQVLRQAGDNSGLPILTVAGAVWAIVVGTASVMAAGAAAFRTPDLEAATAQAFIDISNVGFALIGAAFAVLFGAASLSAWSTRALPRWVSWLGLIIVVLNVMKLLTLFSRDGAFAPGGIFGLIAVIPIWIWTVVAGVVLVRGRAGSASATARTGASA